MAVPSSVQDRLRRYDPALRLREVRGDDPEGRARDVALYAVERKDRAGNYQRIGTVRPDLLGDGTALIAKLHQGDVWRLGGGNKAADLDDEHDRREAEIKKRKRKEDFIDRAKDGHDHIARRTGQRVSNAGLPQRSMT